MLTADAELDIEGMPLEIAVQVADDVAMWEVEGVAAFEILATHGPIVDVIGAFSRCVYRIRGVDDGADVIWVIEHVIP